MNRQSNVRNGHQECLDSTKKPETTVSSASMGNGKTKEADATARQKHVITDKGYKTFTVGIDATLDRTIDDLKEKFGKTSRADVFRMGIALLKVAAEARERELKLTISDQNDVVRKEILLP